MDKLIFAVVQSRHNKKLKEALLKDGFRATELLSQGAFLGKRSSTFMMAVSDSKVRKVLEIIKANCKRKSVFVSNTVADPSAMGVDLPIGSDSAKLEIGGALVFVLKIEKTERI